MASTVLIMQENTEHQTSDPIPIDFLYRDTDIAVVNKPSGMLVHRGWDNDKVVAMTVVRDLVGQHVYPVHRLDRPTSGALIFALHKDAARVLSQEFEAGNVQNARWLFTESGLSSLVRRLTTVPMVPGGPNGSSAHSAPSTRHLICPARKRVRVSCDGNSSRLDICFR